MITIKRFFYLWTQIIIGVAMTLASAIITNYYIAKNNQQIALFNTKATAITSNIEEIWQNSLSLEQKKETALMLLITAPDNPISQDYASDILKLFNAKSSELSYANIKNAFDNYKSANINQINDKFLIQKELEEKISVLKQDNATLMNYALFFQIMGLIFVLTSKRVK